MHVFIDTNIFLSFYHLTSDDLKELEKMAVLIKNKSITLHLPEQVKDETCRNRASKIKDKFKELKKEKFSIDFPSYCKGYKEYEQLQKNIKECKNLHANMIKSIENDINNRQLEADILIENLFKEANFTKRTSDIISKARERIDVGNPPGKNNSLGDAINWETLLFSIPERKNICIISGDKDLCSPLNDTELNDFLLEEWKKKKKQKPDFYRKLSDFFKEHFPDISLSDEIEKDTLIKKLSESPFFSNTHLYIDSLSKYDSFSEKQAKELIDALLLNPQIYRIIKDEDVHSFYKRLHDKHYFSLLDRSEEIEALLH